MRTALVLLLALTIGACTPAGNNSPPPPSAPSNAASPANRSAPLPPAADGSNLDACQDGQCQVMVTAPAEFMVRGVKTSITVKDGRITLRQTEGGSSSQVTVSGPNGTSTVGTDEGQVTVKLRGVSGNNVVLDISSS